MSPKTRFRSATTRHISSCGVIASVSDNLKSSQTAKDYHMISQGLREDCQAFVDRRDQWNGVDDRGIPPFLESGDYVMTLNDDKVNAELRIAVTLARPARLYALVDNRAPQVAWLAEGFVDTGWDIGIDEGYDDVEAVKTAVGPARSGACCGPRKWGHPRTLPGSRVGFRWLSEFGRISHATHRKAETAGAAGFKPRNSWKTGRFRHAHP